MRLLNLCLHNIISEDSRPKSPYELTIKQLDEVIACAELGKSRGEYDDYMLYFDDSYRSFSETVIHLPCLSHINKSNIKVAVIVEKLGQPGYMCHNDLIRVSRNGYGVVSHGYSHAALAVFREGVLQDTPSGGGYQKAPYGQGDPLTVNEVRYQFIESKQFLVQAINAEIDEFALPYGLYNEAVIDLIQSSGLYERVLTCHTAKDVGDFLAPRYLVTQFNLKMLPDTLLRLPTKSQLLY